MNRILIKNAKIVNEGTIFEGDVLIEDERIAEIAPSISAVVGYPNYRCRRQLPDSGAIDDQVHFREPDLPIKATLPRSQGQQ
jgi:dihydroorotase